VRIISLLNKRNINHLIFWLSLAFIIFITDPPKGPLKIQITGVILAVLSYACTYYINLYFIFPKFYKNIFHLLLAIIASFIFFMILQFLVFGQFLGDYNGFENSFSQLAFMFIPELFLFSFITMPALGAYQNKISIEKIKLRAEKEKKLRLKELEFLRNQFNSHITFDFLNRCHSIIHNDSAETAEAIEVFSRMLRYSLNSKAQEKVQLKQEIEYIEDFIKLQKLLSTSIMVNLSIKGDRKIYILPRILIGFVENAFKHGDLYSVDLPINIALNVDGKYLDFTVSNKKNKHKIVEPSGIGNFNLKQQLELLYKDKYKLKITDEDIIYSSHLKLQIT
jgi:two-component system LytT family sensor kinase